MGEDAAASGPWGGAFGPAANPAGRMSADRVSIRAFEPRRQRPPERPDDGDVHVEIPRLTSAVDLVQELATQRWRRTVAQRLADHLGEDVWAEAGRDWLPSHCKKLAKAAGNVAGLDPGLSGFDTVLGRERIKDAVKRARVGAALVDRVTTADTPVDAVVAAMAATGFSPAIAGSAGDEVDIALHSCPLAAAAREDPATICQLHHGLIEGFADATGDVQVAALHPATTPGTCCHVVLRRRQR